MWKHVRHDGPLNTCYGEYISYIRKTYTLLLESCWNVCALSPNMTTRTGQQSRREDVSYMIKPRGQECKQHERTWKKGCCRACTAVGRLAGSH